jgi:arylsulfatase A-like enzyme
MYQHKVKVIVALALLTLLSGFTRDTGPETNSKPNFVLILTDDQGWNALSTRMDPAIPGSGSTYYQTPNLDQLAKEGMRFSWAYASAPTCSPTRHSIQFGRSPASLQIWGADGIKNFDAEDEESLANQLKRHHTEYATAHLGKWHIGHSPDSLGYDVNTGATGNIRRSTDPWNDPKFTFSLSEKAIKFMEEQVIKDRPFFLQISYYADHLFFEAKKETIEKYTVRFPNTKTAYHNNPIWAAMNEDLDTGIGLVLKKIDELGIRNNTYVIFTSDNGYEAKLDFGKSVEERGYYKAYPQRSHKYMVNEGGIRVPFIVRGPGIPSNTHSREHVVSIDIFPTVMDAVGSIDQMPERVEGASLLPHLKSGGKEPIKRKDPFLIFRYTKPNLAHDITIVEGDYKLLRAGEDNKLYLWNLNEDIGERKNLADEKPELAQRMYRQMTDYFKRFGRDENSDK